MKNLFLFLTATLLSFPSISFSQQTLRPNEFKIGMFGFRYRTIPQTPSLCTPTINIADQNLLISGFPNSQLNVLSEDGFNVAQNYSIPDFFVPEYEVQSVLRLVNANNLNGISMKLMTNSKDFYYPTSQTAGNNDYDNGLTINGIYSCGNADFCKVKARYHCQYFGKKNHAALARITP